MIFDAHIIHFNYLSMFLHYLIYFFLWVNNIVITGLKLLHGYLTCQHSSEIICHWGQGSVMEHQMLIIYLAKGLDASTHHPVYDWLQLFCRSSYVKSGLVEQLSTKIPGIIATVRRFQM